MARIRSIHPGVYTDEAWASVSIPARWFAKGICTEADDNGVFEWKPLGLKMRIFPADNIDVPALLDELQSAGIVMAFTEKGKKYGAIRNFCRYQRPRKPKAWFPINVEVRKFVDIGASGTEPDEHDDEPVPQKSELDAPEAEAVQPKSENPPQMEDGRGRREDGASNAHASSEREGAEIDHFEELWKSYPHHPGRSSRPKALTAWAGVSEDLKPTMAAAAKRYAVSGKTPPSGAPALAKWLIDELYRDWIRSNKATANAAKPWVGPSDVRDEFEKVMGEDWTASYLDHCQWQDVPERAIIPASRFAGNKIVSEARKVLSKLSISVLERAA